MTQQKHTPAPWRLAFTPNWNKPYVVDSTGEGLFRAIIPTDEQIANAQLMAASPELLAFAECSAAMDCAQLDPRFDPQPTLRSHGWNGEENHGVFLARIRRDALNKAVGHYLGRPATSAA